jgi:hypothetical protein
VDDIVAAAVQIDGAWHHWLTWGRLFGGVEYDELAAALAPHLERCGFVPRADQVVFETLRMASSAPWFHECFYSVIDERVLALLDDPSLRDPDRWIAYRRAILADGGGLWYCGEADPNEGT